MPVSANLRGVNGTHAVFDRPHTALLKLLLKHKHVSEFHTPEGLVVPALAITSNINPGQIESISFPTHVLRDPSLCELHVQNFIAQSALSQLPLMGVIHQLAQRMVTTVARLDREAAEACRDYTGHGYLLLAEMEIVTTTVNLIDVENYFLEDEETFVVPRDNNAGAEFELLDEQVLINATSSSRASSSEGVPRTRRHQLQPIEKLRKTEHELVVVGGDQLDECCCSICLEMNLCDMLVRFGCNHVYHKTCILKWLDKHDSCPLCRRQLCAFDV